MSKPKSAAPAAVEAPDTPQAAVTVAAELIPPVIDPTPPAPAPLDKAGAAKAVSREVAVLGEDGKPTGETESRTVSEDEVLAFAVRGDQVTVVTIDGQKLVGSL